MHTLTKAGPSQSICKSCLISLRLRHPRLASTAQSVEAVQQEPLAGDHGGQPPIIFPLPSPQRNYQIQAAVILSRPPTLTRDLTPFEKAYFLYQRRLNERLALPFTRYFYYQRDSPGDVNWKRKIKERLTPARDIGVYDAYSEEGWNDELLVGSKESEPEVQIAAIVQDAQDENKSEAGIEGMVKKGEEIEKPMERVTEADRIGDTKSLNRALTQTLYLVVKSGKDGERWRFPSNDLKGQESLHTVSLSTNEIGSILLTSFIIGSRAYIGAIVRPKYVYVGSWQCSNWPPDNHLQSRRTRYWQRWGEAILHEGPYHGRSSESEREQVRARAFRLADQRRNPKRI